MRSRVVPIREMREKYGMEVKDFPYAFIIKHHHPGWEASLPALNPTAESHQALPANQSQRYIEVKRRP